MFQQSAMDMDNVWNQTLANVMQDGTLIFCAVSQHVSNTEAIRVKCVLEEANVFQRTIADAHRDMEDTNVKDYALIATRTADSNFTLLYCS